MKKLLVVFLAAFCSFNVIASPVNINTADVKTIGDNLSGIGLKKAEAIVKYREVKGPFESVDDLLKVDGVGEKTLEKIKSDVLLSGAVVAVEQVDKQADKKTK